ncbi:MAG: hypothetical protein NC212_02265 [Staphylococcus sp.]|nr:hypothetical protein [Staphylococcus sp.]
MKKKFIPGLLLVAITATGFSTLTSCKDTDDDLRTELKGQQANLQAALDKLKAELEANKCDCPDLTGKLHTQAEIEAWINAKTQNLATQSALDNLNNTLKDNGVLNLTADQVKNIIALAAQSESLLGVTESVDALKKAVFGDENTTGLVKWFDGIGITPAEFQEYVKEGEWVKNNKAVLELLNKEAIEALNDNYKDLAKIGDMYSILFPDGTVNEDGWWNYNEVITNIKANSAAIEKLQKEVDSILGRINDMVTGLLLQATTNPVFGSVNTPFGMNSMVLMSYYGKLSTGLEKFPSNGVGAEYNGTDVDVDWAALTKGNYYHLQDAENVIALDENGKATLGNLWFTVNPGTVNTLDLDGFALVNSKEEASKVALSDIVKDDDTTIKFGFSRAAGNGNGLYRATATVAPEDLDAIKINIEPGLKDALINAVKNHTITDIAVMGKAILNQLENVCDANALRYTWTSSDKDADGNLVDRENKVYSEYGIAATAFKPLSFATLYGESIGKPLPTIDPIELDKDLVDLDLKPFQIGDVTLDININIESIKIDPVGKTIITVKVPSKFDVTVDKNTGEGVAVLPDNWEDMPGYYDTVDVDITGNLQEVVDKIQDSIDTWILGDANNPGLNDQINNAIKDAVDEAFNGPNGLVTSIENQVNDMMGSIQGKLDSLVDKINSDYLGKVNSLIGKVNSVSERINKVLANPNHYLQSMMMYKGGNDQLHILSANPNQPSQFKGAGEAIELWATTYNFETICPVFKKFVGVTKVTKNGTVDCPELAAAANKSANLMATVLNGDANRVVLDVKGATNGVYTYEIAYQALDYTGHTSTVKCYVQVVR